MNYQILEHEGCADSAIKVEVCKTNPKPVRVTQGTSVMRFNLQQLEALQCIINETVSHFHTYRMFALVPVQHFTGNEERAALYLSTLTAYTVPEAREEINKRLHGGYALSARELRRPSYYIVPYSMVELLHRGYHTEEQALDQIKAAAVVTVLTPE